MALNAPLTRLVTDAALKVITALPAQNTTAYTASLDVVTPNVGLANEKFDLLISLPATPSLPSGQTITLTVQDSADNATFAAIPALAPIVVTSSGSGGAAVSQIERLPGSTREFVRLQMTTSATAGTNAQNLTWQFLF